MTYLTISMSLAAVFSIAMNNMSEELIGRMELAMLKCSSSTQSIFVNEDTSVFQNTHSRLGF